MTKLTIEKSDLAGLAGKIVVITGRTPTDRTITTRLKRIV